jgi:hypothetical protein
MKPLKTLAGWKSLQTALFVAAALTLTFSIRAGFAPFPFSEGFESGINTNCWTMQTPWGPTWEKARTGGNCLASNPWRVYANNADQSATLGVDLRFANRPLLTFWQIRSLEQNQDYGFVEISQDQGANWTRLGAATGLSGSSWAPVQVDLSGYAGAQVLIRFHLRSDGANPYSGWYIDDVRLQESTATAAYPFFDNMDAAASATNWIASVWQQVSGGASGGSGMSWRCQVGNGSRPAASINLYGLLPVAGSLNLATAVNPKLSFWWRAGVQQNNSFYAQISTDTGKNWNTIWSWGSYYNTGAAWSRQQVDLNPYIGHTNVALRFMAYNSADYSFALDFQVDDVLVGEAPVDVAVAVAAGTDPRHHALLSWTASTAPTFAYYAIYRDPSPGVLPSDLLVAVISNRNTVSFQDTNLSVCGQNYYYRVMVWNNEGLHNWGTNDVVYRTTWGNMATNYPFTDGFENGDGFWALDGSWAISTAMSRTGTRCLASNPGSNYANNTDVSAYLKVDLTTATRPMLNFWQHYAFESNQDYGYVETSIDDGVNWNRLYAVATQGGAGWTPVQVDLGSHAGSQLLIRFRVRSDAQNTLSGWYIDDVQVRDFPVVALPYPFADSMNSTASPSNWVAAVWQQSPSSLTTNGTDLGWRCQIGNGSRPGSGIGLFTPLTLAGTINLTNALTPKLWFWWRAGGQQNNAIYVQGSTDGGRNWSTIWGWGSYYNSSMAWTRQQVDLTSFTGSTNFTFRFAANNSTDYAFALDFQVDDILVSEPPTPLPNVTATVGPGTDPRHAALLTWQASASPFFGSYSIYRSTSAGVDVNDLLVATITNKTTLSYQDTGLDVCGQTYYYRVMVRDNTGLPNSGGMADLIYRTAWGQLVTNLSFAEGFESGDANWAPDRPWGATTEMARTGTYSMASNPGTNYSNNADVSALLNVDLGAATHPVLSFWHRYAFEPNQDYGYVEVSSDNSSTWTRWYAVTGQGPTNWTEVRIDLAGYAGNQVLIRFRLKADAQNQYDGWHLDDVQITDQTPPSLGNSFADLVDQTSSATNWASSSWVQTPGNPTNGQGMTWRFQIGNGSRPAPGINLYAPLTLSGALNLAGATNPKLSFWWRAAAQQNNALYAQASTDGGKNWSTLWGWGSYYNQSMDWTRQQIDLNSYIGHTNLALRFLAYINPDYAFAVDFQIDEVIVGDAPADETLTASPGPDPRHSAQLNWTASAASDFAYYAIYRDVSPNIGPNDFRVTVISNRNTVSFQDNGLDMSGQTYYYRILAWDTDGLHNWGASEVSYQTAWGQMVTNYPAGEGFESGDANWALDRPWGITSNMSHSGTQCLAANAGGNYADNADTSAYMRVDLTASARPQLSFWQHYAFEPNQDYGFVEVSLNNGSTWTRLYAVTSQSGAGWEQAQVDMGTYAGTQILLRFRIKSDGQNPYSGWYIDDVQIRDFAPLVLGFPLYDGMDTPITQNNWIPSVWKQLPGGAMGGGDMSWRCQIGNGSRPGSGINLYCPLTLANTVNLQNTVNPKLWFSWRAGAQQNNSLYAQASTDNGRNWTTLWGWGSYYNTGMDWTRQQVDLNAYIGYTNLALRFLAYNSTDYSFALDFQIDEVLVAEGGGVPAILTYNPLQNAVAGYPSYYMLTATNGATPYIWGVVSNSLPAGMVLNPTAGIISGTPTNAGTYQFTLGVTSSNNLASQRTFSLTVVDYLPFFPTHSCQAFVSPGTNIVYCQVDNQTGRGILSLAWVPNLPSGWSIVGVQGDGGPSIGPDGSILFQNALLTNSPLRFNYQVRVPAGETQGRQIGGNAVVTLVGMASPRPVAALPNPLFTQPRLFHSADCDTNWVIDTVEASKALSYWRAQSHHLDPTTCDGYAPGLGNQNGPLVSGDFQPPYWFMDGTEINRVLAMWRQGCYQVDIAGVDGFAPGCVDGAKSLHPKSGVQPFLVTQQMPGNYSAGSLFMITNKVTYSGTLLSLLWRPRLPAGWAITNVIADGAPEVLNGEMVWTGTNLPASPITVLYFVQVPSGEQGVREIQNQVEYQMPGLANAVTVFATPDPAIVSPAGSDSPLGPYLKVSMIKKLDNGTVKLRLVGDASTPVLLQSTSEMGSTNWITITNLPSLNGSMEVVDPFGTSSGIRFYRMVTP